MRVALVTHQFLPDHRAGVEIFAHRLGRDLLAEGHEVLVFSSRKDPGLPEGRILHEEVEGLETRFLVRNLFHRDFSHTYRDPLPEEAFEREVMKGFRPEVVHFHHWMHLSFGLARVARERGAGVLATLHDYWLECPRFGTLRAFDGRLCEEVDLGRCSRCLQSFPWRNPPSLRFVAACLRGLRLLGLDCKGPLQRLFRRRRGGHAPPPRGTAPGNPRSAPSGEQGSRPSPSFPPEDPVLLRALSARRGHLRAEAAAHIQRFLCPSRFLLERMAAFGLPRDRLHHHPSSIPRPGKAEPRKPREGGPRFAFLGSVLPHKGPQVLLEAWRIHLEGGGSGQLAIHGNYASDPSFGEGLARRAAELGVAFGGAYDPARIPALLAATDVLVVPSLWFENSPVTILDARVRGIPALVSDLGALPELVPDPRLRFRPGDAPDLARVLGETSRRLAAGERIDPGPLPPEPRSHLEALLAHYEVVSAEASRAADLP